MSVVSTPYETSGRVVQKTRTRQALVDAARELVSAGLAPTIEESAERAQVSRTTAYRYFPNQRALLAAAHPETYATATLLPPNPPADPFERLELAVSAFTRSIVETEAQQRTMLRLSLQQDRDADVPLPLRQGRAIGWFAEALAPVADQLGEDGLRNLVLAIRSAVGIEALVWLTDVAGLSRDEAGDTMRWSARAMLRAALADLG